MSGDSRIEWTDKVWNPVTGCTKVSQGCKFCYAERIAERFWGERKFTEVICHEDRLDIPSHWRKPRKIFVNSMSDLFHPDVPDEFIWKVFQSMVYGNRRHTFQILTKRPERMMKWMNANQTKFWHYSETKTKLWPDPCIWLGVSVENQETADERIPLLLATPAAVRFISYEPALGPVNLKLVRHEPCNHPGCFSHVSHPCEGCGYQAGKLPLDWVIAGGESGPFARPAHPDWLRSVRDQCRHAGIPFFFKQWGEWIPKEYENIVIGISDRQPRTTMVANGMDIALMVANRRRDYYPLLDGKMIQEFPQPRGEN